MLPLENRAVDRKEPNGCSTPVPRSIAAKQRISTNGSNDGEEGE